MREGQATKYGCAATWAGNAAEAVIWRFGRARTRYLRASIAPAGAMLAVTGRSHSSCTGMRDLLHAPRCLDAWGPSGPGVLPDAVVAELVDALA